MPSLNTKSAHVTQVAWEEPVNNGATITEYRLEWQQKVDAEFSQVGDGKRESVSMVLVVSFEDHLRFVCIQIKSFFCCRYTLVLH